MSSFPYENHRGRPTLTLLNVLGVLVVLNLLNVLNVLNVLNMPMDASLACWALFFSLSISNLLLSLRLIDVHWGCIDGQTHLLRPHLSLFCSSESFSAESKALPAFSALSKTVPAPSDALPALSEALLGSLGGTPSFFYSKALPAPSEVL